MAKTRNRYRKHPTSKYKKRAATPQHMAQSRLVKMEKRLTPFVKKDENGKIVGFELDVADKKPQEQSKCEEPTLASVVGSQNKSNELQIVKKNKEGKYIVNRSIQDESNGTLSWGDVIDLIDDALEYGEYPEEIVNQLNAFREKILIDIQAERGLFEARSAPKKSTKPKEEIKTHSKSSGHTYNEIAQNKQYKAEMRAAKAVVGQTRVQRQQKSIERLKQLKPEYLIGPASKKKRSR